MGKGVTGPVFLLFRLPLRVKNIFHEKALFWFTNSAAFDILIKSIRLLCLFFRAMEREAMEFLYAYMPLSDLADYEPSFYLQQVRYAFKAREEMPWGKDIPEDVFRHFVLVYRVNNENLDTARMVFYRELK